MDGKRNRLYRQHYYKKRNDDIDQVIELRFNSSNKPLTSFSISLDPGTINLPVKVDS